MGKVTVQDIAKQLNIPIDEVMTKLEELGKSAPDASFVLDDETIKELTKNASPKNEPKTLKELIIREGTTVKDFAELIKKNPADIIKKLIALGEMTTINQPLSNEAINVLADELGYEVTIVSPTEEITQEIEKVVGDLEPRPPVVTVMGHVDHGKTSLLDAIRKTNIIATEAGGITQHIGAYQVLHHGKKITFIDTPGHEAFTAMRARGAKVTDVAVLVIAADDGVMPQTVEAIDHARAAKVPIIVTINKIDKPNANPEKIKQQLTEYELVSEEWGGSTVFVEISAKLGTNIEELLEMILLTAELQELKASLKAPTKGFIIEAKLDRGRGPVATALIQQGKLRVGDAIISGAAHGKVRALTDDQGNPVEEATPSMPAEVIGFSSVPHAGDEIRVVANEKIARQITEERALKLRVIEREKQKKLTLEELFQRIQEGELQELNIIIKADVQGSIEALKDSLNKLDQSEVKINVIHQGVGAITETDVMLASASSAIVIGFNVRPDPKAKGLASKENVDLRTYRVIYQAIEDINAARTGLLKPEYEEVELGRAEVRATFKVSKIGTIAGAFVSEGRIESGARARLIRDGVVIYDGSIHSLRRFKEDVTSVKEGFECGIGLENFNDIKEGDVIEVYEVVEKPRE